MPKKYNRDIYLFVLNHAAGKTTDELLLLINKRFGDIFNRKTLRAYKKNHGIKSGVKYSEIQKGKSVVFSAEIEQFIKDNAWGKTVEDLTQLVNKTYGTEFNTTQISGYKKRHNIKSGIDTKFKKGHISDNKGQKMSAYQYEICKATMFKKGHIPHNTKPVGSERIDSKDGYTLIKTGEPNKWELKHKVIWEQANGPVPKGHIITFLDGNRKNFSIDNLACISLEENAVLNHMKLRGNKATTEVAINIARIKTKISKLKQKG